jgi:hypothetical protein
MDAFLEVLKYTLPGLIVMGTAYLIIKTFIDDERQKRRIEFRTSSQKIITPIRLQAYERIVLFLERISPDSLIMRLQSPGLTCQKLQSDMLSLIRAEYEHNLSQQIYISNQAWEVVKSAKENIVKIINIAGDKANADAPSIEFNRKLLESLVDYDKLPNHTAIEFIKNEITQFF